MSDDERLASLSERAREKARRIAAVDPKSIAKTTQQAMETLVHELRVHQIELEMQNEELIRTQEELDDARVRYFDLFQRAPIGYLTLGREGDVRAVNIAGAQLLGESAYTIVGRPLTRYIHFADQDQLYQLRRRLSEGQSGRQLCELRLKRGNASLWVRVEGVNVHDDDGQSVTRLALSDIDAEKRAKDLVAESEERFRRLAESTVDFVFTLDVCRDVTAVFGRGASTGANRAVVVGHTRGHAATPAIAAMHDEAEKRALAGHDVVYEYAEIPGTGSFPGDSRRHYQTALSPLRSAAGAISGVVGITRDITAQVAFSETRARTETIASLAAVTGGIAHEINTPLQYLLLSLQLLQESMAPIEALVNRARTAENAPFGGMDDAHIVSEFSETLETALHGVRRIAETVRLMHAPASGRSRRPRVPTDLNALVRHALTTTRTAFEGTTFEVDLADLPPVTCRVSEVEDVVAALIKNAAQAVSEARSPGRTHAPTAPGQVHISTAHDGDDVVITVRDNGVGIPEENRPHIFRPFFTTRSAGGGHGQSLSHAWSTIVDEHAGTLGFETTTDEGASFTIRLPITGRPMPSNPLSAPRPH